jgi:hypothetical protein
MADAVQMNFNVRPETKERVKEMARLTFRGPGDLIDWLVAEAWQKMKSEKNFNTKAVETIIENLNIPDN